jgi:hypothetical protein
MSDTEPLNASAGRDPQPLAFERLLRREMAVEPSLEFLPRVRGRIAAEAQPVGWRWRLVLPLGAIVAACAVLMTAAARSGVDRPPAPDAPPLAGVGPIDGLDVPALELTAMRSSTPLRAAMPRTIRASNAATDGVPVIVDQRQRAALALFIDVIRDGRVTDESFAGTKPVSLEAIRDQLTPVQVSPVTVGAIEREAVVRRE